MTASLLQGVERLRSSLDYHLSRHNLLTANLAHVDTPGYVPKDLERTGFASALRVELATTDAHHLAGRGGALGARVIDDPGAAAGADGNAVSIEREAAKIAANNVRYDAVAALTTDELAGLLWAANDGRTG